MTNPTDPAFPVVKSDYDFLLGHDAENASEVVKAVWSEGGMTKLEHFAAMAMQGALAAPSSVAAIIQDSARAKMSPTAFLARISVERAQALIEALNEAQA